MLFWIVFVLWSALNVYAFGLMAYDKWQARRGGWRISEARLKRTALYGGSVGMVAAMQVWRHKTQKSSFYLPVYGALGLHLLLFSLGAWYF